MLVALLQFIFHLCVHPLPRYFAFLTRELRDKATTEGGPGANNILQRLSLLFETLFIKLLELEVA